MYTHAQSRCEHLKHSVDSTLLFDATKNSRPACTSIDT